MRVLLFLVLFSAAAGTRDAAFWKRVLLGLTPHANPKIVSYLSTAMNGFVQDFKLTNDRRISHFLGQCAIESAHFTATKGEPLSCVSVASRGRSARGEARKHQKKKQRAVPTTLSPVLRVVD
jgi:hypothetical protein